MKILIGTPVHVSKDYSIERWLKNVSKLEYPADLLMIDNSSGPSYVEKVKGYCTKCRIRNYRIEHFEIKGADFGPEDVRNVNVEVAQEMIRREVLKANYDAWFSWECDQIIPTNALDTLVELMQKGNYMMVVHNSWARFNSTEFNTNMGCTLMSKESLKRGWFLPSKDSEADIDLSARYNVDETMFKKRLLKSGGNYVEVYGIIKPIYHLDR